MKEEREGRSRPARLFFRGREGGEKEEKKKDRIGTLMKRKRERKLGGLCLPIIILKKSKRERGGGVDSECPGPCLPGRKRGV